MFQKLISDLFIMSETWEKPLAKGYKGGVDRDQAKSDLDNSNEVVPGDTEFPTYQQLINIRNKMKQSDKDYTKKYSEWSNHKEGEK